MLTEHPGSNHQGRHNRIFYLEALLLLAVTPLLLFPTFSPLATTIALLLLPLVWLGYWAINGRPLLPTPFNAALLLWGLALIAGILVTADPDLTLPKATGLILGLALWRFLALFAHNRQRFRLAVMGFSLLGAALVLAGTFSSQWQFDVPIVQRLFTSLPPRLLRFAGTAQEGISANQLAGTLLLYLPLLVSLLFGWRPPRYRPIALAGLLLLTGLTAGLLFLTQSRSGWLGALGGLAALALFWAISLPPSRARLVIWLVMALFAGFAAAGILRIGPQRLMSLWQEPPAMTAIGTFSTVNFRKEVWRWAATSIEDFSLTGTGLGAFRRVVYRFYPIDVPNTYDLAHAHNIFLQVALDVGLPGLVAYLAILAVAGLVAWRVARETPAYRPLVLGLVAGLVALHTFGLTDAVAIGAKPGIAFWYLLGLLAAANHLSSVTTQTQT